MQMGSGDEGTTGLAITMEKHRHLETGRECSGIVFVAPDSGLNVKIWVLPPPPPLPKSSGETLKG